MAIAVPNIEIDVDNTISFATIADFAKKHKIPAVVVQPDCVAAMSMARFSRQGNFKVICAIDWPKGKETGQAKFRNLSLDTISKSNGFEILLSVGDENYIRKEIKFLDNFLRNYIRSFDNNFEIRYVLGMQNSKRSIKQLDHICKYILAHRMPDLIRTDINIKTSAKNASVDAHNEQIKFIKDRLAAKIKISGNVDSKVLASCKSDKYATSFHQASMIVKDLQDPALKSLLNDNSLQK